MKIRPKNNAKLLLNIPLASALLFGLGTSSVVAEPTILHVDTSAVYTVIPDRSSGDPYKTIQDALSKTESGDTIQLISDISFGTLTASSPCTIPAGMSLTLDLNGKTITAVDGTGLAKGFYLFENKGDFTLIDSASGGQISLQAKDAPSYYETAAIMNQGGTVTIFGGTIQVTGNNWAFAVDNLSSKWNSGKSLCTITGGTLISSYSPIRLYNNVAGATCNLKITGGSISSLSTTAQFICRKTAEHICTVIPLSILPAVFLMR